MPHVITQSCCSDGSCVYACPVNCIHPSPDEPGFATAEMLYIDPDACVDCGACVSACPVGAIAPDTKLEPVQLPFIELNASFYPKREGKVPPTSKLAPVLEAPEVHSAPGRAADGGDRRLRSGGHVRRRRTARPSTACGSTSSRSCRRRTGWCARASHRITRAPSGSPGCSTGSRGKRGFAFYLNVEVGRHVSHAELLAHHHAVLYAVGAPNDRRLDVEGMGLPGSGTATELVAWINGHPDFTELPVDLNHERVVIVGNGNVALDVARILTSRSR